MLDFKRIEFTKQVLLSPKKVIRFETKTLIKFSDIATIEKGKSITQKDTIKGNVTISLILLILNVSNRPENTITISAPANAGSTAFGMNHFSASDLAQQ